FFSSRRRHTRFSRDWSSDVCSSDLPRTPPPGRVVSRFAVINPRQSVDYFFAVGGVVGTVISADQRVYHTVVVEVAHGPERHIGLDRKASCRERGETTVVGGSEESNR